MMWLFSVRIQIIIAVSICVIGTLASWWFLTSHRHLWYVWLGHWLLVVNIVTFVYYGLDKFLAGRLWYRVPELTLHTLSAMGGSPAAFAAMAVFRHKTIKSSFRILFWGIVIAQILITAYIAKLLWWS